MNSCGFLNSCNSTLHPFYDLCRHATHNHTGRNILRNYCPGSYDCPIPDGNSRQHGGICPDPYLFPDSDRLWKKISPVLRILFMVQSCQDNHWANQCPVINVNASLVLEPASSVKENIPSDMDVFSTVRIKRWKHSKTLIHFPACKKRKQLPSFLQNTAGRYRVSAWVPH